jgi:hypothetical protein
MAERPRVVAVSLFMDKFLALEDCFVALVRCEGRRSMALHSTT